MNFKVDDEYFKDKIDYNNLEDNIYSQIARTMAKNVDIDLAKTPLVDILTGYTRYRILQSKIDKAIEYLSKNNVSLNEFTKDFKIIPTNMIMIEFLKGEREDILKEDK